MEYWGCDRWTKSPNLTTLKKWPKWPAKQLRVVGESSVRTCLKKNVKKNVKISSWNIPMTSYLHPIYIPIVSPWHPLYILIISALHPHPRHPLYIPLYICYIPILHPLYTQYIPINYWLFYHPNCCWCPIVSPWDPHKLLGQPSPSSNQTWFAHHGRLHRASTNSRLYKLYNVIYLLLSHDIPIRYPHWNA